MNEEWRSVDGYEGHYEVSNLGRVRRISAACGATPGRILKPDMHRARTSVGAYQAVRLSVANRSRLRVIHRLVAHAFIGGPPFDRAEVNHIDGNPENNVVSNLEWVTRSANARHALKTGLQIPKGPKGEEHARAKLTDDRVREMRALKASGRSGTSIAKEFGVDAKTANEAIRGRTWSHVR